MAGDPTAAAAVGGHGSATGKGSRSSSRHRQFRDRAKTRVDDLQEMFSGLQSARKESRSADAALLEEQVHQMLREWRAELSVASPASSLQNSQGNNQEASDPPSQTLAVAEEEDDASSKLVVPRSPLQMPPSHQTHGQGQGGQNPNPELQVQGEAVVGGATVSQHPLVQEMQGDCGEVGAVANAIFNDQMYYIDHELNIDDFLRDDDYKINLPGSNPDDFHNPQGIGQLEHQQFNFPLDLPPPNSYVDANNSAQNTGDVFFHMSDLLATMCPSPSQYLGPKCALWDCGRPVRGSEECQDYCNPYHAGLALNDDGLLGTRPVMRPRGIDLKDAPLFGALCAKIQGKNVGIPVCKGAATSKSPWNAPELFDLSLLEGESLREWLFFDTPRRAFESGNRKQRSLPDYSGRGWHESRKQVMKDFGGLKKSYYMDPQPSSNYGWHLFEYEINDSDALALYRLEFKSSDAKRSVKSKLASNSLNEIQQQMVRLSADSPVENKRNAKSKPKANQKDSNANTYPALNTPCQVSVSNSYQAVPLNNPNQVSAPNASNQVSSAPNAANQVSAPNASNQVSSASNAANQVSAPNASNQVSSAPNAANQVSAPNASNQVSSAPNAAYQSVSQVDQMKFLNENVVYGPHLPYGYSTEGSDFYWKPSDLT